MAQTPTMQHRHFKAIASIIAGLDLDSDIRRRIAHEFADALEGTNPNFDWGRFVNAAMGQPSNRRDR